MNKHNSLTITYPSEKNQIKSQVFLFPLLLFLTFNLSACSLVQNFYQQSPQTETSQSSAATIEDVLKAEHLIAVIQQNQITLVDPLNSISAPVYKLDEGESPIGQELFDIKVSPKKNNIIWYSPQKGFIKVNLSTKSSQILHQPSDWLNQYPYFEFHKGQEKISFIDNKGKDFITIDLENNQTTSNSIPDPFGNFFRIAPNGATFIFVSGFGQTQDFPEYMITSSQLAEPVHFQTQTALNKRNMVEWLPDSTGVVLIENQNQVSFIPTSNPNQKQEFYKLPVEENIINLQLYDDLIYLETSKKTWHIISIAERTEVARLPYEVAQDLHRPKFFAWYDKHLLLEETLRLTPQQFNRLWITTFNGSKDEVLSKYQEITISDTTPEI